MVPQLESVILEILSKKKVKNQTALAKLLAESGVKTDQSTLSRHLKKMGIEKKDGFYAHIENKPRSGFEVIPVPPNLIVVKTQPGHANVFALKLDANPFRGLVGTIAGDDTILCIIENPQYLKVICNQLLALL